MAMRGDTWMRLGAAVAAIGVLCGIVAMLPLFFTQLHPISILWPLSMLSGVGLGMILWGLRKSAGVRKSLK